MIISAIISTAGKYPVYMFRKINIFIILAVTSITIIVLGFIAIKNQPNREGAKTSNQAGGNQQTDEKKQSILNKLKSIGY